MPGEEDKPDPSKSVWVPGLGKWVKLGAIMRDAEGNVPDKLAAAAAVVLPSSVVYECKSVTVDQQQYGMETATLERADGITGWLVISGYDAKGVYKVGQKYKISVADRVMEPTEQTIPPKVQ